jgi:hypothetical protein
MADYGMNLTTSPIETSKLVAGDLGAAEHAFYQVVNGENIFSVEHKARHPRALALLMGSHAIDRPLAYTAWRNWARYLADNGVDAMRFDYRCIGESTGCFEKTGLEDWEEDAAELARRMQVQSPGLPLFLIGLRFGGLLATRLFARGVGSALLAWSPNASGRDVLNEALMLRIANDYVLHKIDSRKKPESYVDNLNNGGSVLIDGYLITSKLWLNSAGYTSALPALEAHAAERPFKVVRLGKKHSPLISGIGQWQALNPRARMGHVPLNPDFSEFFRENLTWIEATIAKLKKG